MREDRSADTVLNKNNISLQLSIGKVYFAKFSTLVNRKSLFPQNVKIVRLGCTTKVSSSKISICWMVLAHCNNFK